MARWWWWEHLVTAVCFFFFCCFCFLLYFFSLHPAAAVQFQQATLGRPCVSSPSLLHTFVSNWIRHTWRESAVVVAPLHNRLKRKKEKKRNRNNTLSLSEADAAPLCSLPPVFLVDADSCSLCQALRQPSKGRIQIIENVDLINYCGGSYRGSFRPS